MEEDDFRAAAQAGGAPRASLRLGETILRTLKYEEMRDWYRLALGVDPAVELTVDPQKVGARSDVARLCFFRLHVDFPFAQVIGLFEIPELNAAPGRGPGLDHIMFRDAGLEQLFARYDALKAAGKTPFRAFNHGPGTSFYYRDPDGNLIEFGAVNFPTEAEYLGYFSSEAYKKNFDGIAIDPDEYIGRFRSGVSQAELVRIPV